MEKTGRFHKCHPPSATPRAPELSPKNAASQKSTGTNSNDLTPRGHAGPECQEEAE